MAPGYPSPIEPREKKKPRRLVRAALGAAGALVAVPALLVAYLHTDAGGELLRKRIVARLAERTVAPPSIDKVRFSLFSGIEVRGVVLRHPSGEEAVRVDTARVQPAIWESVRGRPTLLGLDVAGARVVVHRRADGTTSLAELFRAPPPSTGPSKPSEPAAYLRLARVEVSDVAVTVKSPDGGSLAVTGLGLSASVLARPRTKGLELDLTRLGASIAVERPDGTRIAVDKLATSARAALVDGAGPVRLGDVTAELTYAPKDREAVKTPVSFGAIEGTLAPGQLDVAAGAIAALLVTVGSAHVKGATKDGALHGPLEAEVVSLEVDADTLAKVTGRKVLAKPLRLDVTGKGDPSAVQLDATLATAGQTLRLGGTLDARTPSSLGYDLTLSSKALSVPPMLAVENPPDVHVGALALSAKGTGTKAETVRADVTLHVKDAKVRNVPLDAVDATLHVEGGRVTVRSLDVAAMGQKLHAEGSYLLQEKTLELDVHLDGKISDALAAARRAGLAVNASPALATLSLPSGARVHVGGKVGGDLEVTVPPLPVRVLGASAVVEAKVSLGPPPPGSEKKIEAKNVEATIRVSGLSPEAVARAQGKPPKAKGSLAGVVHVSGPPKALVVRADLSGKVGAIDAEPVWLDLDAHVTGGVAKTKIVVLPEKGKAPLVRATAEVPLPGRAPAGARMGVVAEIAKTRLDALLPFLPKERRERLAALDPETTVSGDVALRGTARAPSGTVDLEVQGRLLSKDRRTVKLGAKLTPDADGALGVTVDVASSGEAGGPAVNLRSSARFARSPLVDPKAPVTHETSLELAQDLTQLPPERAAPGLSGLVSVSAKLRGTREDLLGSVSLRARRVHREGRAPMDAKLDIALRDGDVTLAGGAFLDEDEKDPLVALRGSVGFPGRGLFAALSELEARPLDVTLDVPERSLGSLAGLVPALEGKTALLGGGFRAKGSTLLPSLHGELLLHGYKTADGADGQVKLTTDASIRGAKLRVAPGEAGTIDVSVPLLSLVGARRRDEASEVPVEISTRLKASLATLLPALPTTFAGELESDLAGDLVLEVSKKTLRPKALHTRGALSVTEGRVGIPGTTRVFRDVTLALAGSDEGLSLTKLLVRESDAEKPDRRLEGEGTIPVTVTDGKLGLGRVKVALRAKDMLVSGGNFGEHDAPRAALSGALDVAFESSNGARRVEVDARDLVLFSPDRQPRAHAQEVLSKGDVLDAATTPQGKLPRPPATPPASPSDDALFVTVRVHSARLYQAPLDLHVKGEARVTRLPRAARTVEGSLSVVGGRLLFGGRWLAAEDGEIRLGAEGPVLDVRFAKDAAPWALRDVGLGEDGDERRVRIHLAGVLGKQEAKPVGLGDSLFEALSVLNLGQVRTITRPDLPASASPQLPEVREIRQSSFMAANLPHLAFLDRAGTTSSPYDGRDSYGRLTRFEGERYFGGGTRRLRVTTRPAAPGRSEGEAAVEWLFKNDDRVVSGAGLQGGTRLGGGPTIFIEWSSKDR